MPKQPTRGTRQVNLELDAATVARLDAYCAATGHPRTAVLGHALARFLTRPPRKLVLARRPHAPKLPRE
jgi:hypothetical protein